jgi:tRNA modification GTPase
LRATCLDILAEIEARIDFEDDLPPLDYDATLSSIEQVFCQVNLILSTAERGELLRSGLKVAIVGRPNVGKSSLLNAWSRSDRAIVTDLPGTTRDIVESQLIVAGIPVQVLDTAGIRSASDRVEQIGVERSRQTARSADLVLLTVSAESGWTKEDEEIYQSVSDRPLILVINKIDLADPENVFYPAAIKQVVKLAAAQNQGIEDLEKTVINAVQNQELQAANLDLAINQRQAAALTRAKIALEQVQETIAQNLPFDFWSIDLRTAIQALGEITGEEVTESVLDRIFSRFCIGK